MPWEHLGRTPNPDSEGSLFNVTAHQAGNNQVAGGLGVCPGKEEWHVLRPGGVGRSLIGPEKLQKLD